MARHFQCTYWRHGYVTRMLIAEACKSKAFYFVLGLIQSRRKRGTSKFLVHDACRETARILSWKSRMKPVELHADAHILGSAVPIHSEQPKSTINLRRLFVSSRNSERKPRNFPWRLRQGRCPFITMALSQRTSSLPRLLAVPHKGQSHRER